MSIVVRSIMLIKVDPEACPFSKIMDTFVSQIEILGNEIYRRLAKVSKIFVVVPASCIHFLEYNTSQYFKTMLILDFINLASPKTLPILYTHSEPKRKIK